MEQTDRLKLTEKSSRNKKLKVILQHNEEFIDHFEKEKGNLPSPKLFQDECDTKLVEGRDIAVCVRARPLLPYELEAGYFPIVAASNPKVLMLEPRLDVRSNPKPSKYDFEVDFAFGPDQNNDDVYSALAMPVIDLGLKGGVCTVFAYGQTGSGKTHTISGILDKIGYDLFDRQVLRDENSESFIKLYLSFYELLGSEASDLLDEHRGKVDIMEDKFGKINAKNATEIEITSPTQFKSLIEGALSHRQTATTFKNDTSSRSHAICAIRVENVRLREVEDGKIFVIDLAGSENAADAQFHDRSRIKETQAINKSLMALKDCIRNRALQAVNVDKYYHIPYRLSKLTLLLKEAFEVESRRLTKTVVIACVSPSCADASMTLNTLRYVTPIRVGQTNREKIEPNPNNPANWTNNTLRDWVQTKSNGKINPEVLCPFESGMQLLRIPETEFLERVMTSNPNIGEKKAKVFYTSLWQLLIDARTVERKTKLRSTKPKQNNHDAELLRRVAEEKEQGLDDHKKKPQKYAAFNIRN